MDAVLLKIKRQFQKDEAIKVLQAKLSASEFRIGELTSENSELKDEISKLTRTVERLQKELSKPAARLTKEDLKEERFQVLQKSNRTFSKANAQLRKDVNLWRDKYLNIAASLDKNSRQ